MFADRIRKWPSIDAKQWAVQFLNWACKDSSVAAVVAFGSAVRDAEYVADIDLLMIYKGRKPKFSVPPLDVDVRSYSYAEVETLVKEGQEILCWSIKYGEVLHEKDLFWTELSSRWSSSLALPSAKVAMKRAERIRGLLEDLSIIGDEDALLEQRITLLTHLARAHLIGEGTFPASRPELPQQLQSIGELSISAELRAALEERRQMVKG